MIVEGVKVKGYNIGMFIFVKYVRVVIMDKISEVINVKVIFILIGERLGFVIGESMSCYIVYEVSSKKLEL